ncbi:hypothetical protein E4U44_005031 [Claviceps purpurea]|nr:hypothetical protein E4U44_005031 [Claviceps purpurea]
MTDMELGLNNALETLFPTAQQRFCIWHIDNNVEVHVVKRWKGLEGDAVDTDVVSINAFHNSPTRLYKAWQQLPYGRRYEDFASTRSMIGVQYTPHQPEIV